MNKLGLAKSRGEFIRIGILEGVLGYGCMLIYKVNRFNLLILFCLLLTLVGLPKFRLSNSFLNTVRKNIERGKDKLFSSSANSFSLEINFQFLCIYLPNSSELPSGKINL